VLLLVLILVLIAFALLVVALVQGSVAWAWLSVGISVAAAGALLFDWWQRQRALRAEELPPAAPRPGRPAASANADSVTASANADSVTELIPVVPHSGNGSPESGPETSGDPETIAHGEPTQSEQTVLLPRTRPPGSAEEPSGATPRSPLWASRSPNVTSAGALPARWEGHRSPRLGEHTTFAGVDGDGTATRSNGARPGDTGLSGQGPPAEDPGTQTPSAPDAEWGATTADVHAAEPRALSEPGPPPAGGPPMEPGPAADSGPPVDPEPPADGEPSEESPGPAATAAVAGLQDEVVVVDERPRFHLGACAFLPGRQVIALPVAEAVELGFSPCGWCTPVQVLHERRRASTS